MSDSGLDRLLQDCVFVFDASALLNVLTLPRDTRRHILKVLESLAAEGRLWLPNQAAIEYHSKKKAAIEAATRPHDELIKAARSLGTDANQNLGPAAKPVAEALDTVIEALEALKKVSPEHFAYDKVDERLEIAFAGRVGPAYTEDETRGVYGDAKWRYEASIPPGFEDSGKGRTGGNPYADYVLWRQTLDFAERAKRDVVLVSDDRKRDWCRDGGKMPRPELIREMRAVAGQNFYSLALLSFAEKAGKSFNLLLSDEALKEARAEQERARVRAMPMSEVIELRRRMRDNAEREAALEASISQLEGQQTELEDEGIDSSEVNERLAEVTQQLKMLRTDVAHYQLLRREMASMVHHSQWPIEPIQNE